jgi:hypothetical protein
MEDLDRGRRLSRRRMARAAFWFMIVSGATIMVSLMLSEDRVEIATALSIASMIIGGIYGTLTLIILGYLGFSAAEQIWKK